MCRGDQISDSVDRADVPTTPAAGSAVVDVAAAFRLAWQDDTELVDYTLFPAKLAGAACAILGVDGAGIGVLDAYFRVPLGASSDAASLSERLQFTLGEGPCLSAVQDRRPISATTAQLERTWPLYAGHLFERTPYRAVMSLPIGDGETNLGALDLYVVDSARLHLISASHAIAVVDEIFKTLIATAAPAPAPLSNKPEPRWMHGRTPQSRMAVWIAIGTVMAAFDVADPDALDLIRAYAFSHDDTVDDVAHQLNQGHITVEQLTP